jgi:hypothetical protein
LECKATLEFWGGSNPMMAKALTDLPLPDSPTNATVRSRGMTKDTSSTARTGALEALMKSTVRFLTSNKLSEICVKGGGVLRVAMMSFNQFGFSYVCL